MPPSAVGRRARSAKSCRRTGRARAPPTRRSCSSRICRGGLQALVALGVAASGCRRSRRPAGSRARGARGPPRSPPARRPRSPRHAGPGPRPRGTAASRRPGRPGAGSRARSRATVDERRERRGGELVLAHETRGGASAMRSPYAVAARDDVSTTTGASARARSWRATWKPSSPGRPTSSSTMSGRSAAACARAVGPSAASPTTVNAERSSSARAWRRNPAWSSTRRIVRMASIVRPIVSRRHGGFPTSLGRRRRPRPPGCAPGSSCPHRAGS